MKWTKFYTKGTNYLTTMTNSNKPSKEMNETNQTEDPNPELNEDLNRLIVLSDELKNTREPSRVSLTTSIQNIIEFINIAYSEIISLSEYRARVSIIALVYPKRILKT